MHVDEMANSVLYAKYEGLLDGQYMMGFWMNVVMDAEVHLSLKPCHDTAG